MTKNDLMVEFLDTIERARGRINDPLAGHGKRYDKPIAAQGGDHIAFWETVNTFKTRQIIQNNADTVSFDVRALNDGGLGVSDIQRWRNSLGNIAASIDTLGGFNTGSGFAFYPSGIIGSGFAGFFQVAGLTANRSWVFPNAGGTVMVRAGAVDLTGRTAVIAATQILSAANAVAAMYQVNAEVFCTTAGTGSLTVNILETDNVGAFTDAIIAGFQMTGTGRTQNTKAYRVTGAASFRYSVTGTFTGTYALYIRVNSLS